MAHVLVDTGSSLNVLPKKALERLDCKGLTLKPSNIVVRAFDGGDDAELGASFDSWFVYSSASFVALVMMMK